MKIIGLLSIPKGLLCKKDVLGKTFYGSVSNIDIAIMFPKLANKTVEDTMNYVGLENQLIAPEIGRNLKRGEDNIFWGYSMSYPDMNSFIENVMIEFECTEENYSDNSQAIYKKIYDWIYSFKKYIQLVTKQQLSRKTTHPNNNHCVELLFEGKYIQDQRPQMLQGTIYSNNVFASQDQIKQALAFASSEKELLLEYQMLLSAYTARKNNKNRQSVIDACSAIEICLINWIENYCKNKEITPTVLTEKYRSLGDRFKLVKKLDEDFPDFDFNNKIVAVRNNVAHNRDIYPSNEITDQLIELIENYLSHYHTKYY